jgi:hypothetical protein
MQLSGTIGLEAGPRLGSRTPVHTFEELSSDGVTIYRLKLYADGTLVCPCKGYSYKQRCRHWGKVRSTFLHVQQEEDS